VTPSGPEIKQNHLALKILERYDFAGAVREREVRGCLALFCRLQGGAHWRLAGGDDRAGKD
jgi:hypothetical protein